MVGVCRERTPQANKMSTWRPVAKALKAAFGIGNRCADVSDDVIMQFELASPDPSAFCGQWRHRP